MDHHMAHYDAAAWPNRRLSFLDEEECGIYQDYDETRPKPIPKDPGNLLIYIALVICVISVLALPLFVRLGKYLSKKRKQRKCAAAGGGGEGPDEVLSFSVYNLPAPATPPKGDETNRTFAQKSYAAVLSVLRVVRWRKRGATSGENTDGRRRAVTRGMAREARESLYLHRREAQKVQEEQADSPRSIESNSSHRVKAHAEGHVEIVLDPEEVPNDNAQLQQGASPDVEKGGDQLDAGEESEESVGCLRKHARFLWTIVQYDNETKRILRLAIPFTCSAMAETISDLVILALISLYLGTDNMIAYAITDVVCGISTSFMGGWVEAVSSLGSQAYGAGNYTLVGQYVQTSCIGFVLCEIPMAFVWGLTIDKIILLMGFDEAAALIAKDYVWILVAINMVSGVNEAILDFLEVAEHEAYANVMYCVMAAIETGLVALFIIALEANLVVVGLVSLTHEAFFFFINILIANRMGWLRRFELGLFGRCSLRNKDVVNETVKVALPLAFGSLLAYAEWEVLTVFAAVLGPAEAATWALLGFLWDTFESTTEALGDAGEVRCAYQLGKGRPALAKLSSYKSIFLATLMALLTTTVFLALSPWLPSWLTCDPTIEAMVAELFPLMALGNITMNAGMICWALIGAQGRYRLATSIAIGCSLLITIPLSAIATIWLRIDLQGMTFAVIVGYVVTAMLLSIFLLLSNWDKLSAIIREKVALEAAEGEDSDDDSSSSSSSSSSSCGSSSSAQQPIASNPIGVGSFELTPGSESPPPRSDRSTRTPEGATSPLNSTRKSRSELTPEEKQAVHLTKLRSLSTQYTGSSPVGSKTPNPGTTPGSSSS